MSNEVLLPIDGKEKIFLGGNHFIKIVYESFMLSQPRTVERGRVTAPGRVTFVVSVSALSDVQAL